MIGRLRRPLTWVWVVGLLVAVLLGLAIGGLPTTGRDVPLSDRNVTTTTR